MRKAVMKVSEMQESLGFSVEIFWQGRNLKMF